jgi:hydroxymethylbilane synthase
LGLEHRISERLAPELFLPAPGQGALAVTARSDDQDSLTAARAAIHHPPTACAVASERAFLRRLEGGCQVPVAALGELEISTGRLRLRGRVVSLTGEESVEGVEEATAVDERAGDALGTALAERLLGLGAAQILATVRAAAPAGVPEP